MLTLFDRDLGLHYGFFHLCDPRDGPPIGLGTDGQANGLCGVPGPGSVSMPTGLHTGHAPLRIELHGDEPAVDPAWEEIVEVSFTPVDGQLALMSFDDGADLEVPALGPLRVRYCASRMDEAARQDTILDGEPTIDRYLVQLWPAAHAPDTVVRVTSDVARRAHASTPPPP